MFEMSSKSGGTYDTSLSNVKIITSTDSARDQNSSYSSKEVGDDVGIKCTNNGKTNLATFFQSHLQQQPSRTFKIGENVNQPKTLSYTSTPARQYNGGSTMQHPPQSHSSSQPVTMSSKMCTTGVYVMFM